MTMIQGSSWFEALDPRYVGGLRGRQNAELVGPPAVSEWRGEMHVLLSGEQ